VANQEKKSQPQVLGAAISIRGEPLAQVPALQKIAEPDTSPISAKSFLVFDLTNGQILLEKNPDQKLAIASLTKLLTAFVVYQNSDLNQNFTISAKDTINVKPNLGLRIGDSVKTLDLFNAMLIGSCNDSALALADYTSNLSKTSFVDLMNRQAANLGMANSRFSNPVGFDSDNNYSTANDIKNLITATQSLAAFKTLGRRTSYEFTGTSGRSYSTVATNKLLKDNLDIEAIKTGFTKIAGGSMASKLDIAGHEIIILVLGSQNRESDTLKLKSAIVTSFRWG
jgi:D-alanyl-D-alanine carboxypeptidase